MVVAKRIATGVALLALGAGYAQAQQMGEAVKDAPYIINRTDMMPAVSEQPEFHADGSISIRLGMDSMNYLFVSVDENGKKTFTHIPTDEASVNKALTQSPAKVEVNADEY